MKHLRYRLADANLDYNEKRDALEVMGELGITYQHRTAHTGADIIIFWNSEHLPKELPPYLEILDSDPMDSIGYGLSKEKAEEIRDYNPNN